MKKIIFILCCSLWCVFPSLTKAETATTKDVYDLVLQAYEVLSSLGEEALPAINDPKGEFVVKDTYVLVEICPHQMVAHPFALNKLKDVDLMTLDFNIKLCEAGEQPGGAWVEYQWPKPGEETPSRKVSYSIKVEGTPYTVMAGIFSDTADVDELNKTLK